MLRLYHLIYLLIIAMETSQTQHVDYEQLPANVSLASLRNDKEYISLKKDVKKSSSYSEWARWSVCQAGYKTRRRHCLRRRVCGNTLRIEVARCGSTDSIWKNTSRELERTDFKDENERWLNNSTVKIQHLEPNRVGFGPEFVWQGSSGKTGRSREKVEVTDMKSRASSSSRWRRDDACVNCLCGVFVTGTSVQREHLKERPCCWSQNRQLDIDVQKMFRGFSPWSTWSPCSRKCTSVRRRTCQKRSMCGRKVIRQSAYCYLEGSYCHLWIRSRMQRRQDPEHVEHLIGFLTTFSSEPKELPMTILPKSHVHTPQLLTWVCEGMARLEVMPSPAPAIHPEDSRSISRLQLPCGRLGRYRGSSRTRLRARMNDMIRIIGGRPAPFGKWTWQVAVLNRFKEAFCGGTLISLRWVVTAAHCVRKRLYVRLGEHDLLVRNHGEVEMKVTEAVVHPHYDPDTVVNDVAMLRLPLPAQPELGHGMACLPRPYQTLPPHTTCVILGWGKKKATDVHGTRILHEAQVSTIQQGVCRRAYWQYAITDNMVCAGRGHRDSCAGDSGGPLLCRDRSMRYYLQGITSFGDGCGKRGKYGIYTRTAGYVTWMHEVMNNKYFDD